MDKARNRQQTCDQMRNGKDKDTYVKRVGRRIAEERKRQGLSQQQLAHRMDVSEHLISRWETGNQMPSRSSLQALEQALEVPAEHFLRNHLP